MAEQPKVRLFVEEALVAGGEIVASATQAHYLRRVMRLGAGDVVALFNGRDGEWRAAVAPQGRSGCRLMVAARLRAQTQVPDLWLAFAPVKRLRLDFLAQKTCELGIARLVPVITRRTAVARVNAERLRANAVEAAEQCGRLTVPVVAAPLTLAAFLDEIASRRLFWADESGTGAPALAVFAAAAGAPAALLVGPEGGFAEDERQRLRTHSGARAIALGPRILRAETAALAALALWQAAAGDWRGEDWARQAGQMPL